MPRKASPKEETKEITTKCRLCGHATVQQVPIVRCLNCDKVIEDPYYCSAECWAEDMQVGDYRSKL